jgi:uncharacterized repeat protein (TIGR01451 family)
MKRGLIERVRGTRRRLGIAAVALVAIVAIALPAAASAPEITADLSSLNSTTATADAVVTYGQTAAWRVTVTNNGGNTVNHVTFTDRVNNGTVRGTDNAACSVTPGPIPSFTCNVGQLAVGQSFTARFAFTAPASSTTGLMTNTLTGTFDPQTPNGTTNNRDDATDTFTNSKDAQLVAIDPASISTYGLPGVKIQTQLPSPLSPAHKQFTEVDLPSTLTSGFGTPVQLTELAGGPCTTCVQYQSVISIPDSVPVTGPLNPFTSSNPFTWSILVDGTLLPNPGFKPAGIYHDGVLLPFCSVQPITAVPICVLTLSQDKKTKTVYATGLATTNGSYQFG